MLQSLDKKRPEDLRYFMEFHLIARYKSKLATPTIEYSQVNTKDRHIMNYNDIYRFVPQ